MKRVVLLFLGLLVLVAAVGVGFRGAAVLRESAPLEAVLPDTGELVAIPGMRLFVQSAGPGDGVPIVMVHGTGAWSELWRPTFERLGQEGHFAMAFDLPPFGYSDRAADGDYSRQAQALRINQLVDAIGRKPVVVAHSFGAAPALEAVLQNSDAYAGLVIVAGAIGVGTHENPGKMPLPLRWRPMREIVISATATNPLLTGTFLRGMMQNKSVATSDRIDLLQRPLVRQGSTAAYADWVPTLLVPPSDAQSTRREALEQLDLPVQIIWGSEDTVTPLAQGKDLHDLIPGAEIGVLKKTGHIPQIEAADAFQAMLLAALDRILEQDR